MIFKIWRIELLLANNAFEKTKKPLPTAHRVRTRSRNEKVDFLSVILQKDLAGMYPPCIVVESSDQERVLPQEDLVPGYHVALLRRKTAVIGVQLWWIVQRLRQTFELQLVLKWQNELLEIVYLKNSSVPGALLRAFHCRLRHKWCQARAHWRTEWRSVVFSNESGFCFGASDGRVLVTKRPGEHLQPNCFQPRQKGPTIGVVVWGAIFYDNRSPLVVIPNTLTGNLYVSLVIQPVVLSFMNRIQGGVFQ